MRNKTYDNLLAIIAFILCFILGIVFKLLFDTPWISVMAFAYTGVIAFIITMTCLDIINALIDRVGENKYLRLLKQEEKDNYNVIYNLLDSTIPYDVKHEITKKTLIDNQENDRLKILKDTIAAKNDRLNKLKEEIYYLEQLIKKGEN